MLNKLEEYLKPDTLEEAWQIYNSSENCLFITGGLSVSLREDNTTSTLIDLKGIIPKDLEKTEGEMTIGGGMSVNELIDMLEDGLLKDSLKVIGSNQIRNMSSISGGIAQKYSWSDLITIFLAMDCELELYNGELFNISLKEYLEKKSRGIVLKIKINTGYNYGKYYKFSRTTYDVAVFNAAIFMEYDGYIKKSSIVCGARPLIARKLEKASEYLINRSFPLSESEFEELNGIIGSEASFKDNADASKEYRYKLLRSFLKKTFKLQTEE